MPGGRGDIELRMPWIDNLLSAPPVVQVYIIVFDDNDASFHTKLYTYIQ